MRTLLNINNLIINQNPILKNLNLSVIETDRIGLIGNNGTGKTTLLKLINNGRNKSITHNSTIAYSGGDLYINNQEQSLYEYLSSISEEWWEIISTYSQIFYSQIDTDRKIKDLSGGELIKITLAHCFSKKADLVLLDEPTNHLDSRSNEQLKNFILNSKASYLIASHDIKFLDNITNKIWAIEQNTISVHFGNYSKYLDKKVKKEEKETQLYKLELTKIKKLQKSSKERETQSKLTHIKVARDPYVKKKAGKKARVAKVMKKKIEKRINENLKKLERDPYKPIYISLEKNENDIQTTLFKIKNANIKIYDVPLINDVNFIIRKQDRILIEGDNGSGKSTFLKYIFRNTENLIPTIFLDQKYLVINRNISVWDNAQRFNINNGYEELRKILGNFLFRTEEEINRKAGLLSGGELTRLALAIITIKKCELLILDEPTNNLDINAIESLINALNLYEGALVVVSHNTNFIERINIRYGYKIMNNQLIKDENFY